MGAADEEVRDHTINGTPNIWSISNGVGPGHKNSGIRRSDSGTLCTPLPYICLLGKPYQRWTAYLKIRQCFIAGSAGGRRHGGSQSKHIERSLSARRA